MFTNLLFVRPIVAPLLTVNKEKAYTNFWGGQNEKVRKPLTTFYYFSF